MLADCVNQYLVYLAKKQKANGSFSNLTSCDRKDFQCAYENDSVLSTSFIVLALAGCEENLAQEITAKGVNFLLSQKNENWIFNENLNSTFCAILAINKLRPELITGDVLVKILGALTSHEIKEGGPYKTQRNNNEVNLATNAAVACFLADKKVELPELNKFINAALEKKNLNSYPYINHYPALYLLSLFYGKTKSIIDHIILEQDKSGKWGNPLNTSLAVLSILNLGGNAEQVRKNVDYLAGCPLEEITRPHIFLTAKNKEGRSLFVISPSLVLAFYISALKKYLKKVSEGAKDKIKEKENILHEKIKAAAVKKTDDLQDDLKNQTQKALAEIIAKDGNKEIALLPYFFREALRANKNKISDGTIEKLGSANLFLWTAYSIYDDFLDDEGDPKLLSSANFCLREYVSTFKDLLPYFEFQKLFSEIMNNLDSANAWEILNCRGKIAESKLLLEEFTKAYDYEKLAERSLAHGLGPIAILFFLGFHSNSEEVKNLISFFKYYLMARQMNDDAHDWEEDMKKGHLNSVLMWIIQDFNKHEIDLEKDLSALQRNFWLKNIIRSSLEVIKNSELAGKYAKKLDNLIDPSFFEKLLAPVKNSAQKAIKEQREFLEFLENYKQ